MEISGFSQMPAYVGIKMNILLTPSASAKNGIIWVVLALKGRPIKAQHPKPPAMAKSTKKIPHNPNPAWDLTKSLRLNSANVM